LVQELRKSDGAAGAADVGDLRALHGAGRAQNLLDGACGLIPAAAGRSRHEDLEKVDRLRARVADGEERQRQSSSRHGCRSTHEITSGQHGISFPARYSIGASAAPWLALLLNRHARAALAAPDQYRSK